MTPLVSVVIPHFNRSDLLEIAVNSVLESTEHSFEVIVVDDGSRSEHLDRAMRLASEKVRVMSRSGEPKGPSRCRNQGVAASTSEFIVFLDSDDVMAPWCLEQRLAQANAARGFDMWVFPVMLFDQSPGDRDELWNRMENGIAPELRFMRSDPPWHTSSPLWKRDSFSKIGGFNENVFYGDDSDLHMRAIIEGLRPGLNGEAVPDVFIRRSGADRITNSTVSAANETRPARLREGTRYLLANADRRKYLEVWEGQYFAEAEYLLFNERERAAAVTRTIAQWERDFESISRVPMAARIYLKVALQTHDTAYFALRAARRAAMALLPSNFVALAPEFQTLKASPGVLKEIRRRLEN